MKGYMVKNTHAEPKRRAASSSKTVAVKETQPAAAAPFHSVLADFTDFLREQKVISLATAVVLGTAVTKLVGSLVADIINPVIGVLVGAAGDLSSMSLKIGPIKIMWGSFVASILDFIIVASVVYLLLRVLKFDKIDKPKK